MRDRARVLAELLALARREGNWWLLPIIIGIVIAALFVTVSALLPLSPLLYPFI